MPLTTIEVRKYPTASAAVAEALKHEVAVRYLGECMVVGRAVAVQMEAAGVEFAYLFRRQNRAGDRVVVSVPVNAA